MGTPASLPHNGVAEPPGMAHATERALSDLKRAEFQ